jgi:hypothetical protein
VLNADCCRRPVGTSTRQGQNRKSKIANPKPQEPKFETVSTEIRNSKFETRNGRRRHPKKGNLSETEGSGMGAKRVIFGGFGREKRGQKGVFGASKAGKKGLFCVREG